jgi:hypothetical protein
MTAAAMAAKLMEQYDLAITDVRSLHDERIARESKPFASGEHPREMHAAGIYVAVAVGEFFDCKCWRNHTEIVFFGLRDDAIAYAAGAEAGNRVDHGVREQIDQKAKPARQSRNSARNAEKAATTITPTSEASKFLMSLGTAAISILRSFFWIAAVFMWLSANPSLLPASVVRFLLWLDSAGALAPAAIGVLIAIPAALLYRHLSPRQTLPLR